MGRAQQRRNIASLACGARAAAMTGPVGRFGGAGERVLTLRTRAAWRAHISVVREQKQIRSSRNGDGGHDSHFTPDRRSDDDKINKNRSETIHWWRLKGAYSLLIIFSRHQYPLACKIVNEKLFYPKTKVPTIDPDIRRRRSFVVITWSANVG